MEDLATIQAELYSGLQTELEQVEARLWDLRDEQALLQLTRAAIMNTLKEANVTPGR